MAGAVRERMIDGAITLLATRGLEGTSFAEVLQLTGTPRGSVYHHFPGGKDELVGAAIDGALHRVLVLMGSQDGAPAEDVARFFLHAWRLTLTRSGFAAGCALVAVAVATDSAQLRQQTADAFRSWQEQLATLLEHGGLTRTAAVRHAGLLLAASEGAVVISRALGDLTTFDDTAGLLVDAVRQERARPAAGSAG
jgi:AcrR family transcriptional regulator